MKTRAVDAQKMNFQYTRTGATKIIPPSSLASPFSIIAQEDIDVAPIKPIQSFLSLYIDYYIIEDYSNLYKCIRNFVLVYMNATPMSCDHSTVVLQQIDGVLPIFSDAILS